jgi:hypothetical protein
MNNKINPRISTLLPPPVPTFTRFAPRDPGADRTLIIPPPKCQSTLAGGASARSHRPEGNRIGPIQPPVGPLIKHAAAICRSGEYPQPLDP